MSSWRKWLLPIVLVLGVIALLVRVDAGIWDPWEMNRAHVARQLAGRAKVLVVDDNPQFLEQLERESGTELFITGTASGTDSLADSAKKRKKPGAANRPGKAVRVFKKASEILTKEIFHGIYVRNPSAFLMSPS